MFESPEVNSNAVLSVIRSVVVWSRPDVDVVVIETNEDRASLDVFDAAEKKASSETSERGRAFVFALGGGVTLTSLPSRGPLETVTGEPSPKIVPPTRLKPNPRPGLAFLARLTADANSASKSVNELVRRSELLRLGAITRGSPG